jgi:hypothetical protein
MIDAMDKPTEPVFIRDGLFTRCVCPLDGTWMHVTAQGLWECDAGLHQWHRWGHSGLNTGGWKLFRTFIQHKQPQTIERALRA